MDEPIFALVMLRPLPGGLFDAVDEFEVLPVGGEPFLQLWPLAKQAFMCDLDHPLVGALVGDQEPSLDKPLHHRARGRRKIRHSRDAPHRHSGVRIDTGEPRDECRPQAGELRVARPWDDRVAAGFGERALQGQFDCAGDPSHALVMLDVDRAARAELLVEMRQCEGEERQGVGADRVGCQSLRQERRERDPLPAARQHPKRLQDHIAIGCGGNGQQRQYVGKLQPELLDHFQQDRRGLGPNRQEREEVDAGGRVTEQRREQREESLRFGLVLRRQ